MDTKKELIINKYYKVKKQQSKTCKSKSYNYYITPPEGFPQPGHEEEGIRISVMDVYDNVKVELLNAGLKSIAMTTLTKLIPDRTPERVTVIERVDQPDPVNSDIIPVQQEQKKERKQRSDKGKVRIPAPNLLKLKCI